MADNADQLVQDGCFLVCENNVTDFVTEATEVIKLQFLTNPHGKWIEATAKAFEVLKGGKVQVEFVDVPFSQLFDDIVNEATSKIALYDGFVTPPVVSGSIVEHDGWADLTEFIKESAAHTADWNDILLGYRKYIAQYQDKIIMYPLDGDILTMYYRKDVLEQMGLKVPRTWDEYNEVAAATHGLVYENQTMVGSCIGRTSDCAGSYWANLLISSLTQAQGLWSGHLFDTDDMTTLANEEVLEQTLKWMEAQVDYGASDEFDGCVAINQETMQAGKCVLTYDWGGSFKHHVKAGLAGRLGVAPTPGSQQILDRETGQLVDCTQETCRYGTYYEDIGWVNQAPYLAFGGWACAVNNYTGVVKKRLATEFCAFASSEQESIKNIIPDAETTSAHGGQDPFRQSHLDLKTYVKQGYDEDAARQFIQAIEGGIGSVNAVTDIRFPTASKLNVILDHEFHNYLHASSTNRFISIQEIKEERRKVASSIHRQWKEIISTYDAEGSTRAPILESYQKLRGVFVAANDLNQLNQVRVIGFALAGLVIVFSIAFSVWTLVYRRTQIVRASQPFFLVLICFGTAVLSSALVPLGIDDRHASVDVCNNACVAVPWLLAVGWSIVFSALFSKLRRLNIVFREARRLRRVKVSEKDVLLPFAILFTCNVAILLIWTIVSPIRWERIEVSATGSYGACRVDSTSNVSKICVSLLGVTNGIPLIWANVEAYRARTISVEYGESKYIALAMASILQVFVVSVPLLFLVYDNPSADYFLRSAIIFIISASILLLIFCPKIYFWQSKDERPSKLSGTCVSGLMMDTSADDARSSLAEIKRSLSDLQGIMVERGIDADYLFRQSRLLKHTFCRTKAVNSSEALGQEECAQQT